VSTIHGTKGGEADNVVVFSDISAAAQQDMTERPDDMHRVFYVAVTRTRERLFIIEGENLNRSYDI
jgi:superfamily I DNA/RNA helicase